MATKTKPATPDVSMQELARRIGKDQETAARFVTDCGFELVPGWDGRPWCSTEAAAYVVQSQDRARADGELRLRLWQEYEEERKEEQRRVYDEAFQEAYEAARQRAIRQLTDGRNGIVGIYRGGNAEHRFAREHAQKVLSKWLKANPMKDMDEVFREYRR